MKPIDYRSMPRTVSEMLDTYGEDFYNWQAEEVDSGGWSHSSDRRERYSRCHDAAEDGCDGSTHAENIQDFREFGEFLFGEAFRELWRGHYVLDAVPDELEAALDSARDAYMADCDALEAWHEKNGSLNQQVG